MRRSLGRDWRVVVLAVGGGGLAVLGLALAGSIVVHALAAPLVWPAGNPTPSAHTQVLYSTSCALVLLAGVLLIAAFRATQAIAGAVNPPLNASPLGMVAAMSWVGVWIGTSFLAQITGESPSWMLASPVFQLAAIASPIYLLTRMATGGIPGGSRIRSWGALAGGLALGTGLAAAAEIALLGLVVTLAAAYVLARPELLANLQSLAMQMASSAAPRDILRLLRPVLLSPLAPALALLAVSAFAPVIEEFSKSVVVWGIADRLATPAQGFWAGAFAGAGFALFEAVVATIDGGQGLGPILLLRGGSSLMHIVASAIAGWGVASCCIKRNPLLLVPGYAIAMALHSLWNAAVVAVTFGGIHVSYGVSDGSSVSYGFMAAGGIVLLTLVLVLPAALVHVNSRLRRQEPSRAVAAAKDERGQEIGHQAPAVEDS